MDRLNVTDQLVADLARQVEPFVRAATGWNLKLDTLRTRALPKNRGYEEVLLGRLTGAGIAVDAEGRRGIIERLIEYIIEGAILAAYQPATGELLVIRENVDDSNLDGLRLLIAHELVHRGQHLHHPELFQRIDTMIRDTVASMNNDAASVRDVWQRASRIQPLMTIIESHAHYVQEELRENCYPDAVVESHMDLPALLFRILGHGKVAQYTNGIPTVAAASAKGDIDSLYNRFTNAP